MPLVQSTEVFLEEAADPAGDLGGPDIARDLGSHDAAVRRTAIQAALLAGETTTLVRHLEGEPDQANREAILNSLARAHGAEAAGPLLDLLRSEDVRLRNAVIETLQTMGDAIVPEIERLLDDPDSDVRIFAVNVVHALRSARVPDIALKVASTDPDINVCAAAVDILAELGRPDMAGALRDVAARFPDEPFLAFAVRAALKRIG
jgi:HEAT repeat protein